MATPAAGPDRFLIATTLHRDKLGSFYHLQFVWETPAVETLYIARSSNAINLNEGIQFGAAVSKNKPDPLLLKFNPHRSTRTGLAKVEEEMVARMVESKEIK